MPCTVINEFPCQRLCYGFCHCGNGDASFLLIFTVACSVWQYFGKFYVPATPRLKADIETAVQMLYSLFSKIWEKEEVPAQWKEGIIIKLPKKGDLRDCSNYRGIMLLSTPGKALNRILLERMKEAVDPKLRSQLQAFVHEIPEYFLITITPTLCSNKIYPYPCST